VSQSQQKRRSDCGFLLALGFGADARVTRAPAGGFSAELELAIQY